MTARPTPTGFTVSKDCSIDGVSYARGDVIDGSVAKGFRALNRLVSSRILVPSTDPSMRETDLFGFGSAPRKHPTPTSYSPTEIGAMS